jgi:sugar phosphate isomerase/epimerase
LNTPSGPTYLQTTRQPPSNEKGEVTMQSSIQLWSLRLLIEERGWDYAIESAAIAGFRNVEPFALDRTADLVRPGIVANALAVPTAHGFLDADTVDVTLAHAAALGVKTVFHPHFDESHWGSVAAVDKTAQMLNTAARRAREYGMTVGFHNHDHELSNAIDGVSAFDRLLDMLEDDIEVEFDVNWAAIARTDPTSTLREIAGRVKAVHVKDGPLVGSNTQQRALGEGELDLDAFVGALPENAVLVLSLDQFTGSSRDVAAAVATSRAWLDARGVS